jgi:hypothetical protein
MKPFNPKPRPCPVCASPYTPVRPMQAVCSPRCAARKVKKDKATEKAADRIQRDRLKPRGKLMAEAQNAFNAYIRARDAGLPCICCGRYSSGESRGGEWDAGHYRSRGAAPHLRFDERNAHAQLKQCNRYAFDAAAYRLGLIERIGLGAVEALEADQTTRKWTSDDLREIRRIYTAKLKELEATR